MKFCILMVTDFFYPNCGGVENHVYHLSQCLMELGHKVVVVTHGYGDCAGVRYLTNGLKVYYLYRRPFYQQSTLPTFGFGTLRMLRLICVREAVSLVHGHQAFSSLALEACLAARTMGYQAVFTDHSLFGFADAASIVMNKLLKCVLSDVAHIICVSHTSKENTLLRACLPPARVSVIPNAVDAVGGGFQPAPKAPRPPGVASGERVVVVSLSRLVYRKGIDLMALAIPYICALYPNVDFLIGGGGPKARLLAAMIEDHGLCGRVVMEGPVPHEHAAAFLRRGHVFLNASLTEAFCIAVVEAAACGLLVVSTRVGGVPEVLPPDMMELGEASAEGVVGALQRALARLHRLDPHEQHRRVAAMYSWRDVARRTAHVYDHVLRGAALLPPGLQPQPGWWVGTERGQPACSSGMHGTDGVGVGTMDTGVSGPAVAATDDGGDVSHAVEDAGGGEAACGTGHNTVHGSPASGLRRRPRRGRGSAARGSVGETHQAATPVAAAVVAVSAAAAGSGSRQDTTPTDPSDASPEKRGRAGSNQDAAGPACQQWEGQGDGCGDRCGPHQWFPGGAASVAQAQGQLLPRLSRHLACGRVAGPLFCLVLVWLHLWWVVLEVVVQPRGAIDRAWDWPP